MAIAGPRVHTTKMLDFDDMIHTPRSYHLVMTNSSPWNITMLLIGKPSISMGHLYLGYVSHNNRVMGKIIELNDGVSDRQPWS